MRRSHQYPEPLIEEPLREHRQSFIVLHGRGSNADTFGPALLQTELPDGSTVRETLPNVKFIFPTASFRRATIFKRIPITQWFDIYSVENPFQRSELQIEGLRETSEFVHGLLKKEIELVGPKNVVLGGLSQGCAAMLIALLLWTEDPICAAFGMSGWLPFRDVLTAPSNNSPADEESLEDDIFDRNAAPDSPEDSAEKTVYTRAIRQLKEELEILPQNRDSPTFLSTPVFLGHGADDEKVAPTLGEGAYQTLSQFGNAVIWKKYDDLGHWYHSKEIAAIVAFVNEQSRDKLLSP